MDKREIFVQVVVMNFVHMEKRERRWIFLVQFRYSLAHLVPNLIWNLILCQKWRILDLLVRKRENF